MSKVLEELKYTKEHEWVKKNSEQTYRVGITDYAQNSLGDIVYLDLKCEVGSTITKGASIGVVESVKAVEDLYAPLSGVVTAINVELKSKTETINQDSYMAWMFEIKIANTNELNELLDANAYKKLVS